MGGPDLKIAILIPCYGNPEAMFLQSLTQMISFFYEANIQGPDGEPIEKHVETFVVSSSMLTEGRHRLAAEALNSGADYLLWCDADHTFPEDALCRLWSHGVDIVGCNYPRRCSPTAPTAAKVVGTSDAENLVYTTLEKAQAGELETVDHLGFGLCLMRASVLDALQLQAEAEGRDSFMPLFIFTPTDNHRGMIGEDVYFFKKCRDAGLTVWLDHGLSWEVGHINKQVLTNAHAVAHRERWGQRSAQLSDKFEKRIAQLEGAG